MGIAVLSRFQTGHGTEPNRFFLCMSGEQNYSLLAVDQSGWPPIGCEGLYSHAACKNRVSVSGWSPIGCEGFSTNLSIPSPLSTTSVFREFWRLLIYIYILLIYYFIIIMIIINY